LTTSSRAAPGELTGRHHLASQAGDRAIDGAHAAAPAKRPAAAVEITF